MRRDAVLAIGLVALVALAGCSALDGSASTPGANDGSPTPEPFVGPDESVGGSELADQHERQLRSSDDFTVRTNLTFSSSSNVATEITELRANPDEGVYWEYTDGFDPVERYRYTDGDETLVRVVGDSTTYDAASEPYDGGVEPVALNDSLHASTIEQLFDGEVDLENRGTTTHDGVTTTEFAAAGADSWNPPNYDTSDVTEFDVRVLVDRNGVVRLLEYRVVEESGGESTVLEVTVAVSDVGSTDVTEPDWLDEARDAAE